MLAVLEQRRVMAFRLRFKQAGGHMHCRLFQATSPDRTWAKNGDLTFDEAAWPVVREVLELAGVQVLPDD